MLAGSGAKKKTGMCKASVATACCAHGQACQHEKANMKASAKTHKQPCAPPPARLRAMNSSCVGEKFLASWSEMRPWLSHWLTSLALAYIVVVMRAAVGFGQAES